MQSTTALLLLLYAGPVSLSVHQAVGVSGQDVVLSCQLSHDKCGDYHSIKWYKEGARVAVYSPATQWWRVEGTLKDRARVGVDQDTANLTFKLTSTQDEGQYKCEITFLDISQDCPVVQVTHLIAMARPKYINITLLDGAVSTQVTGDLIGPYHEGTEITLRCEVEGGKPAPHVFWFMGDKLLDRQESSQELLNSSGSVQSDLKLKVTREALGSKIVCKVANEVMDKYLTASVQLDVYLPPVSTILTGDDGQGVDEGEDVHLVCSSGGARPAAVISWYNGSLSTPLISPAARHVSSMQEDATYHTISHLVMRVDRHHHNNTVYCKASNEVSEDMAQHRLMVRYSPVVEMLEKMIVVNKTGECTITCDYKANPPTLLSITWLHHNISLDQSNPRYDIIGGGNPALIIRNTSIQDSGSYTCVLSNQVGSGEDTAMVRVQAPPRVRLVMEPLAEVREGDQSNVSLRCEGEEELVVVQWFMDNILLQQLPQCEADSSLCGVDPTQLILESVNRHFHGNYSCVGINSAGPSKMSPPVSLTVFYPPGPPTIVQTSHTIYKDGAVTFTCLLRDPGKPPPSHFVWTRGGYAINGQTSQNWTINPVTLSIQTNISCHAVNTAGEGIKVSKELSVLAQPSFVQNLPPLTGYPATAKDIQLTCQVECSPLCHIGWYRNGSYIKTSNKLYTIITHKIPPDLSVNQAESTRSTLRFNINNWPGGRLDPDKDNTEYSCQSTSNCQGSQTSHCQGVQSITQVMVQFPPKNLKISDKIIKIHENEKPRKIHCTAEGFPKPKFSWKFPNHQILKGPLLYFRTAIRRKDAGSYICEASNHLGVEEISTKIDVLFKPECIIHQFVRKDKFVLKCEATGNPGNISVVWRKDNYSLSSYDENTSRLEKTMERRHAGEYYCQARNSVGQGDPCKITVTVLEKNFTSLLSSSDTIVTLVISSCIVIVIAVLIIVILFRRYMMRGKEYCVSSQVTRKQY